jgi:hypothetical protein
MPKKPNYNFEKRQKELVRKQRQEEKRARKREDEQRPDSDPESAPAVLPGNDADSADTPSGSSADKPV